MIDVTSANYSQEEAAASPTLDVLNVYPQNHGFQYLLLPPNAMQEIIPGVFLGSYSSAQKHCQKFLLDNDIKCIVCVRQKNEAHIIRPQLSDQFFTYLTLEIEDAATENIIRFFPRVRQFIDEALSKNCKVLVHGNNGNSRSASLVLAYIMEKFGFSCEEAYKFVKQKRESITLNEGFFAQLSEYEPIYKARQTLNQGEPSRETCRKKRKCEHLTEVVEYDLIQPPPSPISDNNNDENCQSLQDISSHLFKLLVFQPE